MRPMNSDNFMQTAHLLLGLSRQEIQRRLTSGQLDPQVLKAQIEQNSQELKLEVFCEKCIDMNSLDQIDKFSEPV